MIFLIPGVFLSPKRRELPDQSWAGLFQKELLCELPVGEENASIIRRLMKSFTVLFMVHLQFEFSLLFIVRGALDGDPHGVMVFPVCAPGHAVPVFGIVRIGNLRHSCRPNQERQEQPHQIAITDDHLR